MAYLNKIQVDGTNYDIKSSLTFTDKTVSSWAAVGSSESDYYSAYPYRGTISCSGVTADYIPFVVFAPTDADSGQYATIANTATNVVYIYSNNNNSSPIILNIICVR